MKILAKCIFSEILRILLFPLHILPVKKNRIVFTGLTGGTHNEYSCNPKYLYEYIQKNYPGKYEIIWAVSEPEKYSFLEKDVQLIKHFSIGSFLWLMTARVIVSNGSYAPWLPFRKNQYFINTWHGGGAYKKIENSRSDAGWAAAHRARFCANNINLFVSSCKMATKELFRKAFVYQGEVMEVGMPRNDFLVKRETKSAAEKVKTFYGIAQENKIVLYAPTYRNNSKEVVLNADRILDVLGRDGSKWYFFLRMHRYQTAGKGFRVTGKRVKDVGDYPDMQELLAASDVMVTDYSSNIWDYSFLYRPCFLFTPDLDEYLKTVGFYVDIHEWPFPICMTQQELEDQIIGFDEKENNKKIEEHHKLMGNAETGEACRLVAARIAQVCDVCD